MSTNTVIISPDKLYHKEDETGQYKDTKITYLHKSTQAPEKTGKDSLPTEMYGKRDKGTLGNPLEWILVEITGTDELYLAPAYKYDPSIDVPPVETPTGEQITDYVVNSNPDAWLYSLPEVDNTDGFEYNLPSD